MKGPALLAEARGWIGTPYRHASATKGVGCDCLGLILGVARHVLGPAFQPSVRPYSPDWAEASQDEWLLKGFDEHLCRISPYRAEEGDVLLFRWRKGRPASHAAVAVTRRAILHAHARTRVCEVPLIMPWRRRIAAAFRFKDVL